MINAKASKIKIRLPAKKNLEILAILVDLMDGPGSTIKHDEVHKLAGKESWVASFLPQLKPFLRQLWASIIKQSTGSKINLVCERQVWSALSWARMFHEHQRGDLVRHLFLVDQTSDGSVLEVDASTTGAACWHTHLSARSGLQKTKVCCSRCGETLRIKQHGRLSWHCWQSDTLSLLKHEEESFWSGMPWACGMVLCE